MLLFEPQIKPLLRALTLLASNGILISLFKSFVCIHLNANILELYHVDVMRKKDNIEFVTEGDLYQAKIVICETSRIPLKASSAVLQIFHVISMGLYRPTATIYLQEQNMTWAFLESTFRMKNKWLQRLRHRFLTLCDYWT